MADRTERAEIGVFGGSGFYSFLDDVSEVEMDTPYGEPSAPVTIGSVEEGVPAGGDGGGDLVLRFLERGDGRSTP